MPQTTNTICDMILMFLNEPIIRQSISREAYAKVFGCLFSGIIDPKLESELSTIPGEVSVREKAFLFNFLATVWSGKNHVIELGPFLGSSTKAIALGMLSNPRRSEKAKIFTYDRFGAYFEAKRLLETLDPLFARGILSPATKTKLQESNGLPDFYDIFIEIHRREPYFPILEVNRTPLPDAHGDLNNSHKLLVLDPSMKYDVIFIDGCKSWFSTKYFMAEISKCCEPGAYFLSQDFGWYTCFWLPIFWYQFREHFELLAFVDSTYVFQLRRKLDPLHISQLFPNEPHSISPREFDGVFESLILQAAQRGDSRALVYIPMQHAAALAYIGEKQKAKDILLSLADQVYAKPHLANIQRALISPTYYPDQTRVTL